MCLNLQFVSIKESNEQCASVLVCNEGNVLVWSQMHLENNTEKAFSFTKASSALLALFLLSSGAASALVKIELSIRLSSNLFGGSAFKNKIMKKR